MITRRALFTGLAALVAAPVAMVAKAVGGQSPVTVEMVVYAPTKEGLRKAVAESVSDQLKAYDRHLPDRLRDIKLRRG